MNTKTKSTVQALQTTALIGFFFAVVSVPVVAAAFSGNLKEVTITDSQENNKPPVAVFTYTVAGNTVSFDASNSYDSDGTVGEVKWDFGDGSFGNGVQVQHVYNSKDPFAVTLTVIDNNKGVTLSQQSIHLATPINIAISFQPDSSAVEPGYLVDSGADFNETSGYGWTVSPGTSGTRDRNNSLSPNQAYDTFIHVSPTGIWEISLPNGAYNLTICIGDPNAPDSGHTIMAENVTIFNKESLDSTKRWAEKSEYILVSDGKLTLSFKGTTKYTKLCWLKINSL